MTSIRDYTFKVIRNKVYTPNPKMAVARDDLGRAAWKRGIEGQVTTIRHFGIRCIV